MHLCTRSLLRFSETRASAHPNSVGSSIMLRSVLVCSPYVPQPDPSAQFSSFFRSVTLLEHDIIRFGTVCYHVDWSLKVYTQLAREGVVVTQDGDTELSFILSSRRVTARGDSCKKAIGEINLPFLPLSVPLYLTHKSLINKWNSLIYRMDPNRRVHEDHQHPPSSLYTVN